MPYTGSTAARPGRRLHAAKRPTQKRPLCPGRSKRTGLDARRRRQLAVAPAAKAGHFAVRARIGRRTQRSTCSLGMLPDLAALSRRLFRMVCRKRNCRPPTSMMSLFDSTTSARTSSVFTMVRPRVRGRNMACTSRRDWRSASVSPMPRGQRNRAFVVTASMITAA